MLRHGRQHADSEPHQLLLGFVELRIIVSRWAHDESEQLPGAHVSATAATGAGGGGPVVADPEADLLARPSPEASVTVTV